MKLLTPEPEVKLRRLSLGDAERLPLLINNPAIANNLRDALPQPYHQSDAEAFIEATLAQVPPKTFGITYQENLAGIISLKPQTDIHRHTAELGYWVAEDFWGKGIATAAVAGIATYAFSSLKFHRLFAGLMANNFASARVLEKCGFQREAVHRQGILKNGKLVDEFCYARLATDPNPFP